MNKKFWVCVMLTIFTLSLCLSMTGCLHTNDRVQTANGITLNVNNEEALSSQDLFIANEKPSPELEYSFRDDSNAYYLYDLGKIDNVPLEDFSNIFHFVNKGQKVTHTVETTSVSVSSISKSVSTTTEKTVNISDTHNVSAAAELSYGIVKGSLEYSFTKMRGTSESYSTTESYSEVAEYTESNKKTVTMTFDENSKNGYYGYVWTASIEIYAMVVKPLNEDEYFVDFYSEILTKWTEFYFFENSDEFKNYEYDSIEFDVPSNLTIPSKYHSFYSPETETAYINTISLSCSIDNHYNHTQPDQQANNIHFNHQFEFGKFVVENVIPVEEGKYTLGEGESIISFRVEYDTTALPLQDNMTSRAVSDDSDCGPFYSMPYNIGEKKVGYGLIVVLIAYKDGSPSEKICITDAFKERQPGELINIATISKPCTIDIAVVYELVMWAPGALGISDDYWMNWRINQQIKIEN